LRAPRRTRHVHHPRFLRRFRPPVRRSHDGLELFNKNILLIQLHKQICMQLVALLQHGTMRLPSPRGN
jgi:hypothetical protein